MNFDEIPLPDYITKFRVTPNTYKSAKIHLTKEITQHLESSSGCLENVNEKYDKCYLNKIATDFNTMLDCLPPTMASLTNAVNLETCENDTENYDKALVIAKKLLTNSGCSKSCTTEYYRVIPNFLNSPGSDDDHFKIYLMYDNLDVTMIRDVFVYDSLDMVMAVGGILAFFLGFSLLSVLLDCVDVIFKACGYEEDLKFTMFRRTFRQ